MRHCKFCNSNKNENAFGLNPYVRKDGTQSRKVKCKACEVADISAWRKANPKKAAAQDHSYYIRHTEKVREQRQAYDKANPGRAADQHREYAAQQAGVFIEKGITMSLLYARDEGICGICKKSVSRNVVTMDHIIPKSKGGPHTWLNVQLAHSSCNSSKGNRL